jgi:hypothetical protein
LNFCVPVGSRQLLDAGGEGDGGRARGVDCAALVHRYGRSFVHSAPDAALEYYLQARARTNDLLMKSSSCGMSISGWARLCMHMMLASQRRVGSGVLLLH